MKSRSTELRTLSHVRDSLQAQLGDIASMARVHRAAEAAARVPRDSLIARELVGDVVGETFAGTLFWDPEQVPLAIHIVNEVRRRADRRRCQQAMDSKRVNAKPSTMITTECDFRTHIVPRLGDLRLDEVTYAAIEDFKLALTKTQAANTEHTPRFLRPRSIHNLLVHVSNMLGVAKKRGLITTMPEIDWIKIPPSEFDFLDFDAADQLIAAAEGEWRTMILVAMRTGMRKGELLGLRWVDVDLAAGRINVRQSYVKGHLGLPKSGKSREIPLGDDVIEALRAHRHERGPLVFCDAAGNHLTAGLLGWPLKRALKRAGLREIGWHALRHTFASHLAMRGVPLKVIQELLGHASIVTTMIYAHLTPHVARDAVRVLDRARPREHAPNSAPTSAPPPAIPVEVATDWRKPAPDPVTN